MKAFSAFITALFYLLISSGITVQAHYCMGQLAGMNAPWESDSCKKEQMSFCHQKEGSIPFCCAKDQKEEKNCCEEELIEFGINIPAINSSSIVTSFIPIAYLNKIVSYAQVDFISEALVHNFLFYRPPPPEKDLRIAIHSLLFYH